MLNDLPSEEAIVFSKRPGQFGADQGRPLAVWKGPQRVLKERMENQLEWLYKRELTSQEITKILKEIHEEGCGFAAATTIILEHYQTSPELYEIIYGFPFYQLNGNVDFISLLLDFYYTQNNWHQVPHTRLRFKLKHPGIRAHDIQMNLHRYTKEKGQAIKGRWLAFPTRKQLIKQLNANKIITMTSYFSSMLLIAPEEASYPTQRIKFHTVMLVGVNPKTQRFIVSSWGEHYELACLPLFSSFFSY